MAGRGRPFVVAWRETDTEEALRAAYRAERRVDVCQRLHTLWLLWSGTRRRDEVAQLAEPTTPETDLAALAWDRAPNHRDATVREVGLPLIEQPPYAPEPGTLWVPAERVFEELHAGIEGTVYPTIEANTLSAPSAVGHGRRGSR